MTFRISSEQIALMIIHQVRGMDCCLCFNIRLSGNISSNIEGNILWQISVGFSDYQPLDTSWHFWRLYPINTLPSFLTRSHLFSPLTPNQQQSIWCENQHIFFVFPCESLTSPPRLDMLVCKASFLEIFANNCAQKEFWMNEQGEIDTKIIMNRLQRLYILYWKMMIFLVDSTSLEMKLYKIDSLWQMWRRKKIHLKCVLWRPNLHSPLIEHPEELICWRDCETLIYCCHKYCIHIHPPNKKIMQSSVSFHIVIHLSWTTCKPICRVIYPNGYDLHLCCCGVLKVISLEI